MILIHFYFYDLAAKCFRVNQYKPPKLLQNTEPTWCKVRMLTHNWRKLSLAFNAAFCQCILTALYSWVLLYSLINLSCTSVFELNNTRILVHMQTLSSENHLHLGFMFYCGWLLSNQRKFCRALLTHGNLTLKKKKYIYIYKLFLSYVDIFASALMPISRVWLTGLNSWAPLAGVGDTNLGK